MPVSPRPLAVRFFATEAKHELDLARKRLLIYLKANP
jgi:hypothetical protein